LLPIGVELANEVLKAPTMMNVFSTFKIFWDSLAGNVLHSVTLLQILRELKAAVII
jgi:hypothetical protein